MNNFTTATAAVPKTGEALPRSGHVNEVCKEWLVREDGALAYKLQSQEINDFYKGNRYRNAVVREDFPTALHEQIKETEEAKKQREEQRQRLLMLEEHDKHVAAEFADKLERDLEEQRLRELQESELIAQRMQEIYVNMPPIPPPAARDERNRTPPPRPTKASIRHQTQQQHQQQQLHYDEQQPFTLQLQQEHFSNTDNYVGLALIPQNSNNNTSSITNTIHNSSLVGPTNISYHAQGAGQTRHQQPHHQASRTSTNSSTASSTSARSRAAAPLPTSSPTAVGDAQPQPQRHDVEELVDYSDVADSIRRRYEFVAATQIQLQANANANTNHSSLKSSSSNSSTNSHASNPSSNRANNCINGNSNNPYHKLMGASNENLLRTQLKFQKHSPDKHDKLSLAELPENVLAEQHMQAHADDIEDYVDPCDFAGLKKIGLSLSEIKELSKKVKQEQKDELLARRLQEQEAKTSMRQEERDRMLAIEAQDKELARMLQEREKAKMKRAKEKARLRKIQQQQKEAAGNNGCLPAMNCGPLLPLPQDCMSLQASPTTSAMSSKRNKHYIPMALATTARHVDEPIVEEFEAYSNPIDLLENHRKQNGASSNHSSLTRPEQANLNGVSNSPLHSGSLDRDDDIYTLPVDSCRPGQQRPVSLHAAAESAQQYRSNVMSKSELYAGNEAQDTFPESDVLPTLTPSRLNYSKSGNFDQDSSPTPPYMPIQGTRRSNSSEDRKKWSKDKCTHQ